MLNLLTRATNTVQWTCTYKHITHIANHMKAQNLYSSISSQSPNKAGGKLFICTMLLIVRPIVSVCNHLCLCIYNTNKWSTVQITRKPLMKQQAANRICSIYQHLHAATPLIFLSNKQILWIVGVLTPVQCNQIAPSEVVQWLKLATSTTKVHVCEITAKWMQNKSTQNSSTVTSFKRIL